jgi:outer membrane protein insertion porin family
MIVLGVLAFLAGWASAAESSSGTVKSVRVLGLHHMKERKALAAVKARRGVPAASAALAKDVQALYELGTFDDVAVETTDSAGGVEVVFRVIEKPILDRVEFHGQKDLSARKLREKLTLKEDEPFDQGRLLGDTDKIKTLYRDEGFIEATITSTATITGGRRAIVRFDIAEGPRARIESVSFPGAAAFSEKRLRRQLKQRRKKVFKPQALAEELPAVARLYKEAGYKDVQVGAPETTMNDERTRVTIRIPVTEGPKWQFGRADFSGHALFSSDALAKTVRWQPGQTYNEKKLNQTIEALKDLYGSRGYIRLQIEPRFTPVDGSSVTNVTFHLTEGDVVIVDHIAVEGQQATKSFVLRREIQLKEGEPFSSVAARRSVERLYNLGFLDQVEVDLQQPNTPQKADVIFNVHEGQPGMLSAGAGYSSLDKFQGQFQLSHINFLGRGQQIHATGTVSSRGNGMEFGWREPWLAGKPLALGINFFNARHTRAYLRDLSAYRTQDIGGSLSLSPRFSDLYSMNVTYRFNRQRRYDVGQDDAQIQQDVLGAAGLTENSFTYSDTTVELARDSRDSVFDPKRGTRLKLAWTQGGLFPANAVRYYRPEVEASGHIPLFWKTVLSLRTQWSLLNTYGKTQRHDVADQLFRLGGIDTVRGYNEGAVGAPQGGQLMNVYSAEFKFPLVPDQYGRTLLQGLFFYDIGSSWTRIGDLRYQTGNTDERLRQGVGIGLRLKTPAFPVRIEWGIPLNRGEGDSPSRLHFSLGTSF